MKELRIRTLTNSCARVMMQQHDFDALIYEEEYRFNKLEREEVIPRYRSASPPYYRKEHEDEHENKEFKILNL